ncbi:transketolase [Modestobacter sp. I12A-02628]|uniref:Transketolase n=1 Tax=Goekera deserti TaxID=2497753 RepID=A0A7K3WDE7_9ACTN|nr:transketolase [Goekera deserti]MPQ96830.1 transketolase [Goekera deserti]NDI46856.1 transketolase [Goekera deserti]NEL54424.1 transketolase [Goekera deserti]
MTDQSAATQSTEAEAPAEAASDTPTGSPRQPDPTLPDSFGELDRKAVDTARVLAMDAVQKVGNGHPGTAMSMAPTAYLLFQKWLQHDPSEPQWTGRDRFVLSMGHSSLTLYVQLYLAGYGLELDDLRALRTWGSLTPGHPEVNHTPGVETTTGPLGQGVGNAVGMAMAARRERGLFDPESADGESLFDHTVWAFASDGDLEEGVSGEASSLAGTQQLGNLVLVYDDNKISIEDHTDIAFTEDVGKRYEAYGWHVQHVDDGEDLAALDAAFAAAKAETGRPSIIVLRTIIGWPAPNKQNTGAAHGSALGDDEVKATKQVLGFDPEATFDVAPEVIEHTRKAVERGQAARAAWEERFAAWEQAHPERAALLSRMKTRSLPDGWADALPSWPADAKGVATRKASGEVLAAVYPELPELWGGSADLAESNNTAVKGEPSFIPASQQTKMWSGGPYGRTLHFGVREHAMGAIMNGIALHGGTRVYGGTFLTFSDYMRGAVRLAALMQLPVTYVWTHDSIGLGEDGPTHQPIEHYAALRAIPGLDFVRPADANETAVAWRTILENNDRPAGLALSRQNLPTFDREVMASAEGTAKGGYVLAEASTGTPEVILLGTGSEVQIAVAAREHLEAAGTPTRVVSLPCWEWFAEQDQAYREQVLPPTVRARVSVEAGVPMGWRDFVGDAGRIVGLDHYGASAAYTKLYEEFGLTAEAVVAAAQESIQAAAAPPAAPTGATASRGGLDSPTADR